MKRVNRQKRRVKSESGSGLPPRRLPRRAEPRGRSQSRRAAIPPRGTALAGQLVGQAHLPAEGASWARERRSRLCSCR